MEGNMNGSDMGAMKKKGGAKGKIVVAVVILLIIGVGAFFYSQYYNTDAQKAARAEQEVKNVVGKVSKLTVLPSTTTPIIIRIEDPELLKQQQAFFNGSEKGDYLVLFMDVAKAVIYSEKRNIIVNFGVIQNQPTPEGQQQIETVPEDEATGDEGAAE